MDGVEAAELGTELPRSLRRLMGELERGILEFDMRPEGLEPVLMRFEPLPNRLVLGMIPAAFIVGLAVFMALYHPPGWEGLLGRFFAFGFLVAGGLRLYLAWSILPSGRR